MSENTRVTAVKRKLWKMPDGDRFDILFKDTEHYLRLRRQAGWRQVPQEKYDSIEGLEYSLIPLGYLASAKQKNDRTVGVAIHHAWPEPALAAHIRYFVRD